MFSAALVLSIPVAETVAQPASPPPLLRVVSEAPLLGAARHRVDAARSRIDSTGRLADPEIQGMASRMNRPEGRDMYEVTVMQPLPKRGERAAERDRAFAIVRMAEAEYAMAAGALAAEVTAAIAEAEGAEARAKVLAAQLARLDAVLRSIEARLATASAARFADRLAVQTRIAAMQLEVEEQRREANDARDEARGRLGLGPEVALPEFSAPGVDEIEPVEAPASSVASARAAEAEAMLRMARASAQPMTAVGVRFERERSAMGRSDALGLAFSSEIPFRSRRYARAESKAAEAERAAAKAEGTGARHRIASAVSRVERAERLAETARRFALETRARLDAQYDALVRAAGAGTSNGEPVVLMAVEIFERTSETELNVIDADTAARAARAELWRYLPAHRLLPANL